MLGFQDFTSTNSYGYSGFDSDPLMTTALLSDLNSPYSSYATIGDATPASNANNANTDLDVVNSLLAEALGIYQGADTSVAAPDGNSPSWDTWDTWYGETGDTWYGETGDTWYGDNSGDTGDTANVGNVGAGHQTGDPEVDSLLNQSDQLIADNRNWLDSLPKDPLTGVPANSQSTNANNANSDLDLVNSLLGEALGIYQGAGTSVAAPDENSPSGNTANVGNVGGYRTGDPEVDRLLNYSSQVVANDTKFLNSLPKDSIGNPLNPTGNSTSMLPSNSLYGWLTPQITTINDPNTTDAQRKQINDQNKHAQNINRGQTIMGEMNNSITKGEQSLNKNKNDSLGTFGNGPDYADNGWDWKGYWGLDSSYSSLDNSSSSSSEDE
ncbi:MAG: hypothetical protein ACRCU2_06995 [Planktothrix sp.]